MVDQPGVRFGLASGAVVLGYLIAPALPFDRVETAALGLLVASIAGASLPSRFAAALGLEAWAFFTGFFVNQYGVLTFTSHDVVDLIVFVVTTVVLAHLLRARFGAPVAGADRRE